MARIPRNIRGPKDINYHFMSKTEQFIDQYNKNIKTKILNIVAKYMNKIVQEARSNALNNKFTGSFARSIGWDFGGIGHYPFSEEIKFTFGTGAREYVFARVYAKAYYAKWVEGSPDSHHSTLKGRYFVPFRNAPKLRMWAMMHGFKVEKMKGLMVEPTSQLFIHKAIEKYKRQLAYELERLTKIAWR